MEKQKMTVTVEDNEENEETKTIKTTNTPLSPPSTRLPFSSASNPHAYCFVCKRPGPKLVVVPTGERYNIFLQTEIIVPAGARCCPNHLMDGKLSQEAMHSVRTTRQDAFFNRSTLAELLRFLREAALKSQTSRIDFDNTDALADEEYKTLLGLDKEQFADILKYVQLKNTPSRTVRCTLAIFFMKMKSGLPNKLLSTLFNISKSSVRRAIAAVRKTLTQTFTPDFLGFQHITREEIISEHTRPLANHLFGNDGKQVVLVLDGTYIYIQKSLHFQFQRRSYSLHKGRPLVKPMVIVTTSGYFVTVLGPYLSDGKNNDAKIIEHIMKCNTEDVMNWIDENDVFIVDRGFRDALPFLSSLGINAEMPAFMKKGETQMSTEDANCSRLVTKIRWVVESANARIKRWRFLDRTLPTNQIPFIGEYIRIVCAISNKYFRPLSNGNEDEDQVLAAKMAYLSRQVNWLQEYVEEKGFHRKTAQWREIDSNDDFPSLDEDQIRQLTCGTYQMKLCASYAQEHMDGNCDISVHKDEPTLLRVRIQSRHCSSKSYMLWIKYNEACVEAWYCRCRADSRVVGVCAHIAAVIWHLGYSRHSQRRVGVQNWGKYLMDAACVPEEVIDASDSDSSEDEFPEE